MYENMFNPEQTRRLLSNGVHIRGASEAKYLLPSECSTCYFQPLFLLYAYFIMISSYVKAGDAVKQMIIKTEGCLE
jgi:hypothetical protein